MRKSLEDTWLHLESQEDDAPRRPDGRPFVPDGMPNYDDEELGFSFFRTGAEGADYSNLTLPRTYFGRSSITRVSFVGTDLSESRMCWNDFEDCDFSAADLSGCDMRASVYKRCRFVGAVLRGADLRRSTFEGCEFADAELTGAVAEAEGFEECVHSYLTEEQLATMALVDGEGPEPPGG